MRFRFKAFRVYKQGKTYCLFCRRVVKIHILEKDRNLADQIQRARNSILLNIAEGSADNRDTEFARFLSISIRSVYETVAGFDIAAQCGYIKED